MAKLTKTQAKRLLNEIISKSRKLWDTRTSPTVTAGTYMSTVDMIAIEKIVAKNLKRLG